MKGFLAAMLAATGLCTALAAGAERAAAAVYAPNPDNIVVGLAAEPNGDLIAAGSFANIAGVPRTGLARLTPDGTAAPSPAVAFDGPINVLARYPDGRLLVAGDFANVGGEAHARLARIDAAGNVDSAFAPVFAGGGITRIYGLALQPDGRIVAAGDFTTVNGQPRVRVARLNTDGTLDATFDSGTGATSRHWGVTLQPDGKIIVFGQFASYSGVTKTRIARLNPDGSLDNTFGPTVNSTIASVLLRADGTLLIGGPFSTVNGTPRARLAHLSADGALLPGFNADVSGAVYAFAAQADGKVLIGGQFTSVYGQPRANVARLNADGTLDTSFVDPAFNARVDAMLPLPDGRIMVGGRFTQVGGHPRNYLAPLLADGRLDLPRYTVTPAAGAHGTIAPSTPQTVDQGSTFDFTVTPDDGYQVGSVTGCGGTLNGGTYTIAPATTDCTVTATFVGGTQYFTVTPNAPMHGTLSPSTPQQVASGETTGFTVAPDAGWYVDTVTGCGGTLSGSTYTTAPVFADCGIDATFLTPAAITVSGGGTQVASTGLPFALPLDVRVTTDDGRPVAGVPVTFAAPASGASATLSATSVTTDANGKASVVATANATTGAYAVTATAEGRVATFALGNDGAQAGGIALRVTVGTEPPPACGTATSIDVPAGEPVNFCFTVTNQTPFTLTQHGLTFDPRTLQYHPTTWNAGELRYLMSRPLAPGATMQHNEVFNAGTLGQAPTFTWTALAERPRYAVETTAGAPFVDISGTGAALNLGEGGVYTLPVPFTMHFFGATFREGGDASVCIHNSGALRLFRGECLLPYMLYVPPFVGDNVQFHGMYAGSTDGILPWWDLLGNDGQVYVRTDGSAPNRRLIVQWDRKDHSSAPNAGDGVRFEAIVEESGAIRFVYDKTTFGAGNAALDRGASATVGLANHDGYIRQQYAYNTPALDDGSQIAWSPTPMPHSASSQVRVGVGTPRLRTYPSSLAAQTPEGGAATLRLGIGNSGTLPLAWNLDAVAPNAHFPLTTHWVVPLGGTVAPHEPRQPAGAPLQPQPATVDTNPAPASAFAVPAYGVKDEWTNAGGRMYPVGFDAAMPDRFVHVTPAAIYGNNYGGDFAGNDFGKLYVFDGYFDSDYSLSTIDLADGHYTNIGRPQPERADEPPYPRWNGMGWDRTTQTMYASTGGGGRWCDYAAASTLHTIDPVSAAVRKVGDIAYAGGGAICVNDIAVAPNGLLYGIDSYNDALVAIDKTNGAAAAIGSLGLDLTYVNSIDFDDVTGTLYLAAYQPEGGATGGLYAIDLVTGRAQRIARYPLLPDNFGHISVDSLAIARSGGDCAFPGAVPWLSASATAGVTPAGTTDFIDIAVDASALEPGDYAAQLCIDSNDRSRPLTAVPVSLHVDGEAIFSDDFEGPAR